MPMQVLDDIKGIIEIDKENMLSYCTDALKHYEKAVELTRALSIKSSNPKSIIISGMGGSAIGGELLKDWARNSIAVPIEICREYSLPQYANSDSLVIAISYSGETEETLSVFLQAIRRGCKLISISSGGTLQKVSEKLGITHLTIPSGMAPRAALPYLFMPLLIICEKSGLIASPASEISDAVKTLERISRANAPNISLKSNPSKILAANVVETIPTIYGFGFYRSVAQRMKAQFNENSKSPAKWETFPELDHNEVVGWDHADSLAKYFSAIFIRDESEFDPIRLRIETTKQLMKKRGINMFEVRSSGKTPLAKMVSAICQGDFTSVYLAVLRGIDPTPVETINILKKELEKSGYRSKITRELGRIAKR